MASNEISRFRKLMYENFRRVAKGQDGAKVVDALYQASEQIWAAGIDDVYARLDNTSDEPLADAFDLTWLTAVSILLSTRK